MSGCTRELVPIPAGTTILWVQEDQFALMECADPRQMFPNNNSGKYNCVGQQWVGDIPECIPKSTTTTATTTTTQDLETTTERILETTEQVTTTVTTTTTENIMTTTDQPTTTQQPLTTTTTVAETTTTTEQMSTSTTTEALADSTTTNAETTAATTTIEPATTTTEPPRCTQALVPVPDGTRLVFTDEGKFAILECDDGFMFPTNSGGIYHCVENRWNGTVPACIPRPTTTTATPTTTSTTTTTRPTTSTTASAQTSSGTTTSSTSGPTTGSSSPNGSTTGSTEGTTKGGGFTVCSDCKPSTTVSPGDAGMNDMSKTLLGVGLGLIAVLFLIGLSCFIYSVVSRRKKRHQEEAEVEQNLRNKRTENGNNTDGDGVDTLGKPLNTGGLLTDGRTAVWVSSGSIYGGGTYVPIPSKSDTKSENTYLSAEPLTAGHSRSSTLTSGGIRGKNSSNKEQDDQSVPDTRRLILRYSGSSSIESSPTITPPSTRSSSYLMLPPEEGASTTGYDTQGMPPFPPPPPPRPTSSFPGSDVSLTSLYGVDAGVYDGILTDLEPRYITHATADAPTKRRPSVGHCI